MYCYVCCCTRRWDATYYPIPQAGPLADRGDATNRSVASSASGHSISNANSAHSLFVGQNNRIKRSPQALVIHGISRQTIFKTVPADSNIHISACSDCTCFNPQRKRSVRVSHHGNCSVRSTCARAVAMCSLSGPTPVMKKAPQSQRMRSARR